MTAAKAKKKKLDLAMWKRTFSIYGKFRAPWILFIIETVLGIVSGKLAVMYVPYLSDIKMGNFEEPDLLRNYILLLLLSAAISIVAAIPAFYSSAVTTRNLRKKMIDRALRLPFRDYEKEATEMVGWVIDGPSSAKGLITAIIGFITGITTAYMSVVALPAMNSTLFYIVPFIVVYIILGTLLEGRLMFLREKREKTAYADLTAYLSEHLAFFTQIKQLHSAKEECKRASNAINSYYKSEIYQAVLTLINSLVNGSLTDIITILVFLLGVPLTRTGAISLTDLNTFLTLIIMAYQSIQSIPSLYTSIMYYNGQLFYVGKLLDKKEEVVRREFSMDRQDENVEFRHVSFQYSEDKPVLKDLTFTIPKGKVTMVCGPNGSGKTTMLKLLERFYEPDQGEILFGDLNAEKIHLDEWRQSFAYVLQDSQLFDASIRENITYGLSKEVSNEELHQVAKLANVDEFVSNFPEGYDFVIGDNGGRLSGGQKQRIAIARALLLDPSYFLLDEATCNMDILAERKVTDAILNLMKGRTTVIISHDMRMLDKTDYVIVLNEGNLEVAAEKEEAIQSSKTLQNLIQNSRRKEN